MTPRLRQQIKQRANGKCECGCGRIPFDKGTVDHFFGKAKAEETLENCWRLHWHCHESKTRNEPSSKEWLNRFVSHCTKYGYWKAARRAEAKAEWQSAMGERA